MLTTPPHSCCSPRTRHLPREHRLRGADKTNTEKLGRLCLACCSCPHCLTLQAGPGSWEGSRSNMWDGTKWPSASPRLPAPLSQRQAGRRRRRRRRGELGGDGLRETAGSCQQEGQEGGGECSGSGAGAVAEDGVRGGVRGASQRRLSPPLASWAGCRGRQGSSGKGS